MRIDGPQITGSFSIGNTTFPDVSALATTGSNTFVGNQVISGSIVSTTTTLISGSSQVLSGTGIFSSSAQLPSGIISGSSQLPTGIVSSSAQVIAYGVSTTGSNILQGNQIITGSLFISENLVVAGSSSIQHISSSVVNINDNIITVNALNPSVRFGGLAVIDSGSSPQVSGSMLFDSINNQWLFVHQNQGTVTSSVLLMGPETYNNLGNESYITTNRLVKSTGIEHLSDSNITDTGTKVSINSNTEVTGSLIGTSTAVFGSSLTANSLLVERSASRNMLGISTVSLPTSGDEEGVAVIKTNSTLWQLSTVGYAADSKGVRFYNNGGAGYTALEVAQANGTRFIVNGVGDVGIGTASPVTFGSRNLDVNAGAGLSSYIVARANNNVGTIEIAFDTDAGYLSTKSNHPLIIRTNDSERMRITSDGNVLVGSTNADVGGSVKGAIIRQNGSIVGATNISSPFHYQSPIAADRMNTQGDGLMYGMWRGGIFQAGIGATNGSVMTFFTGNNDSMTERMRITSGGVVRINGFTSNGLVGTDASGNLGVVNLTYTEIATGTISYSNNSGASWGINNSFPATIRNYEDEGMAGSAGVATNLNLNRGVTFDLGSSKAVRKIVERGYNTKNLDSIQVQYSTDNSNWTTIHTYRHVYGNTQKDMVFNPTGAISARYWRWLIDGWTEREVQNYYTYESIIYT
jgi:hypothetical protein